MICFFFALAVTTFWLSLIIVTMGLAFIGASFGYAFVFPRIFLKKQNGELSALSYILFWPYHGLNLLTLLMLRRWTRENAFDEVVPGLYLGSRLLQSDEKIINDLNIFSVLDLTCEFSEVEFLRKDAHYLCIPLLDSLAPSLEQLELGVGWIGNKINEGSVYVHCALGRSRSATFVVAYLIAQGIASSVQDAIRKVSSRRPGIRLHKLQHDAVKEFERLIHNRKPQLHS